MQYDRALLRLKSDFHPIIPRLRQSVCTTPRGTFNQELKLVRKNYSVSSPRGSGLSSLMPCFDTSKIKKINFF